MAEIHGVLLAAGRGRRFGSHKLLFPLPDGTPIAVAAARALLAAVPRAIAVVCADDAALIARLRAEGMGIVPNPDADAGVGSSIACGVRALPAAHGVVIALADMPWLRAEAIAGVVQSLASGSAIVAPAYEGRRGHPVGFAARFREELEALQGDEGAREILARHQESVTLMPVSDAGVLRDIDTPVDLASS